MAPVDRTWRFGALRQVALNTDPSAWEEMDHLLKMDRVLELLAGRALRVIGEVDQRIALVQRDDEPVVFVLFEFEPAALLPVAADVAALVAFLDDAAGLWVGHGEDCILPTTADNLELAQIMLEAFEAANPGCDAAFWEQQCFAGLNMGFPLA
jgi:hypothetical protein